jgi:DNA polymerase/3'-5' exonuclease PolX
MTTELEAGIEKRKYPMADILPVAQALCKTIATACHVAVLAGSLRRRKELVSDIEIVCCPTRERNLWGDEDEDGRYSHLDETIKSLVAFERLAWDTDQPRNGPAWKRFVVPSIGIPVDLFVAKPGSYGPILAIRTGPGGEGMTYSRRLVTQRSKGGLMPDNLLQRDGFVWLWTGEGKPDPTRVPHWERLELPNEEAFFDAIGLPWAQPWERK